MKNKVILQKPIRQKLGLALFVLIIFTVVCAGTLLLLRATNVKEFSGEVTEVKGELQEIKYIEEDNVRIVFDGNTYIANRVLSFDADLNLEALVNQTLTIYISKNQVGKIPSVLGIKQGETVLVDYEQVIAAGRKENRELMITFGVVTGVLFVASCGVCIWRLRVSPTMEYDLAQKYGEFSLTRQPSCPEYKKLWIYLLVYISCTVLCGAVLGIVGSLVQSEVIQIAVGVSLGVVFVAGTAGVFVMMAWVIKKEREFYIKNFPFDFTDVSHIPMRKKFKQQLQEEINSERTLHPHRYGEGGNGFTVEFSETGLKFYDLDLLYDYFDTAEDVFGIRDEEYDAKFLVCTIDYKTLNFEALPFYRKKDHPLVVVIKSRLNASDLPNQFNQEKMNDIHIALDSNLLSTLRHFDVPVENLQYILDNKEMLIKENCAIRKKRDVK